MPVSPPDEAADLIAFLQANADLSGVDADPAALEIDHPNYDGGVDTPGVRVLSPDRDVPTGGATGYSGMHPGGGGGTQDVRATLQVDCWGGTTNDRDVLQSHPDLVASQLASAVWTAVLDHGPVDGYQWTGVRTSTPGHDTDAEPVEYRHIVFVGMGYHLRPSA